MAKNLLAEYKGKQSYIAFTQQNDIMVNGTIIGVAHKEARGNAGWVAESHDFHGIKATEPTREAAVREMLNRVERERRAHAEETAKPMTETDRAVLSYLEDVEAAKQEMTCTCAKSNWESLSCPKHGLDVPKLQGFHFREPEPDTSGANRVAYVKEIAEHFDLTHLWFTVMQGHIRALRVEALTAILHVNRYNTTYNPVTDRLLTEIIRLRKLLETAE